MAIRPDWNIGTITLTASSANFTTTGALLETAAIEPGDAIITPSGAVLVISSITGQDSGTLMLPCPAGAAGTNMPLRIRFQPDGSRFQAAYKAAAYLLSGGNVDALAGLVGENGKLPIFTGPGTMDLIDEGDLGIQDPNGNLGELAGLTDVDNLTDLAGLALAARQILQTDANGALKTIALAVNKFLRTDANGDVSQGDITALGAALLGLTGTNGNIPVMTGTGAVASRPIVGTVSQSGGIPTGAIVESGSNANGQYVKWTNGTLICTRMVSYAGSGWKTSGPPFLFAHAFSAPPSIQLTSNPPDPGYAGIAEARYPGNNGFALVAPAITDTGTSAAFSMTAIGRWF
ncbi:hypothetical protein DKP76_07055 [Falsochrobactrum shanghaiense]|uniref:Uncharacterized protein n=1 Tax=Falsochrobactrum shanghaiense TaxID=2201899 RepID=A0A316JDT9_9HYPH|nr:hypothetical protein [Falsochrobactrum shanghaiense]PWL18815.1 hypothetical protein DKP76_07055 [Falsochrobactrum shanghaiense]